MELLICVLTMLTGLLSKILSFNTLVVIHIMNVTTMLLTVVLDMQPPLILASSIFSHLDLFKYQNVIFNLKRTTTIHSVPLLVGYHV